MPDTQVFGRIAGLVSKYPGGQRRLAQEVGVSQSYISRLVNGEAGNPTLEVLERLASCLSVPLWRFFRDEDPPTPGPAALDTFGTVPLLRARIAAGSPLDVTRDEHDGQISFSLGLLQKYPGAFCIRVGRREESMVPTILPEDTVLIDPSEAVRRKPRNGTLYAVNYAGLTGDEGSAVKRVEVADGMLIVSSDNPDKSRFPTLAKPIEGMDLLRVLVGQVVWHGRYLTPRTSR